MTHFTAIIKVFDNTTLYTEKGEYVFEAKRSFYGVLSQTHSKNCNCPIKPLENENDAKIVGVKTTIGKKPFLRNPFF